MPKSEEDEAEAESTDAAAADKGEKGKEKKAGSKDAKESTPSKKAKISPAAAVGPAVAGSNLSENPKPVKVPEQSEEVIAVGRPPRCCCGWSSTLTLVATHASVLTLRTRRSAAGRAAQSRNGASLSQLKKEIFSDLAKRIKLSSTIHPSCVM